MTVSEIREKLFSLSDTAYGDFASKLIPDIPREEIIGVRTPDLRKLASEVLSAGPGEFLSLLPHGYFDENQLHAFILSAMKNYPECIEGVERFLPFVDNWATCDQMSPKCFAKNKEDLSLRIEKWLNSGKTYTVRFAVGMLMQHYLGDDFDPSHPEKVASIRCGEYYIDMMRAWYFATALAKRYDDAVPYIEKGVMDVWTHNAAIRKAVESRRISAETKEYLKSLRRK